MKLVKNFKKWFFKQKCFCIIIVYRETDALGVDCYVLLFLKVS